MNESESYKPIESKKKGEAIITFFGEHVLLPALEYLSNKAEGFEITTQGLENLNEMKDRPCLLVSNHLKPTSGAAEQSQLSPDAFVIQRVIEQNIGITPRIVAKVGDGWWSKNAWYRAFQEKSIPVLKKLMISVNFLPVNKNPGSTNVDFFHETEKAKNNGNSILIFPEGHWYEDFSEDHEMSEGAALLAKKYDLPIIPVYIKNANKWKKGQPVFISFGKPFLATSERSSGRHETTKKIRSAISELQKNSQTAL